MIRNLTTILYVFALAAGCRATRDGAVPAVHLPREVVAEDFTPGAEFSEDDIRAIREVPRFRPPVTRVRKSRNLLRGDTSFEVPGGLYVGWSIEADPRAGTRFTEDRPEVMRGTGIDGSGAIKLVRKNPRHQVWLDFHQVSLEPGKEYVFSFSVRSSEPSTPVSAGLVDPAFTTPLKEITAGIKWERISLPFKGVIPDDLKEKFSVILARPTISPGSYSGGGVGGAIGARVWIDDVQLEEVVESGGGASEYSQFDVVPLYADLKVPDPGFFRPQDPLVARVHFYNSENRSRAAQLVWRLSALSGLAERSGKIPLNLSARQGGALAIDLGEAAEGFWQLEVWAVEEGVLLGECYRAIPVIRENRESRGFFTAVAPRFGQLERLASLGVRRCELPIRWRDFEPERGKYDFDGLSETVEAYRQKGFSVGLRVFALVNPLPDKKEMNQLFASGGKLAMEGLAETYRQKAETPLWAHIRVDDPTNYYVAPYGGTLVLAEPEPFGAFCDALAKRFRGAVDFYRLGQGLNRAFDVEKYLEYLNVFAAAVKRGDECALAAAPSVELLSEETAPLNQFMPVLFSAEAGRLDMFDLSLGLNMEEPEARYEYGLDRVLQFFGRQVRARYPDIRLAFTDPRWFPVFGGSERLNVWVTGKNADTIYAYENATRLSRTCVILIAHDYAHVHITDPLRSDQGSIGEGRLDSAAPPAANVVSVMERSIFGPSAGRLSFPKTGVTVSIFRRGDTVGSVAAVWCRYRAENVWLKVPLAGADGMFDFTGAELEVKRNAAGVFIPISDGPVFVATGLAPADVDAAFRKSDLFGGERLLRNRIVLLTPAGEVELPVRVRPKDRRLLAVFADSQRIVPGFPVGVRLEAEKSARYVFRFDVRAGTEAAEEGQARWPLMHGYRICKNGKDVNFVLERGSIYQREGGEEPKSFGILKTDPIDLTADDLVTINVKRDAPLPGEIVAIEWGKSE